MKDETRIMAHMVAFYPDYDKSLSVACALVDGGAAIVEIQFPFSDPTADGAVIQRACKVALENGFSVKGGLKLVENVVEMGNGVPVFVMSYANLVFTRGIENFLRELVSAGADGLIVPDLPPDYDEGLYETGKRLGINVIPVLTVTVSEKRMEKILTVDPKYVYVALRKGITGEHTDIDKSSISFVDRINKKGIKVLGGFGIAERGQVEALMPHVYAAVVGSAFVREIQRSGEDNDPYPHVLNKIKELMSRDTSF